MCQATMCYNMPCQGKSWNIHGCIMIVSWSDRAYYDPFSLSFQRRVDFLTYPCRKNRHVFKEHVQKIDTSPSWEPPERRQLPRAHMVLLSGRGYCIAKIARMFNAFESSQWRLLKATVTANRLYSLMDALIDAVNACLDNLTPSEIQTLVTQECSDTFAKTLRPSLSATASVHHTKTRFASSYLRPLRG